MKRLRYLFQEIMYSSSLLSAIVIIYSTIGLSSIVHAETAVCDNIRTSRCFSCPASMMMNCNGIIGNIRNDARLDHLKVIITSLYGRQRTVTLHSPPGGIRNYYAIKQNDWIPTQIRGLRYGDEIEIAENGFGINDRTPLYKDSFAREQIGTAGEGSSVDNPSSRYSSCSYSGRVSPHDSGVSVLDYPSSCSNKICFADVECYDSQTNQRIKGNAACPINSNGSCPTANECAINGLVKVERSMFDNQGPLGAIGPEGPRERSGPGIRRQIGTHPGPERVGPGGGSEPRGKPGRPGPRGIR